ncbi:MAG: U32 family peptidase [Erysipelotrichales bacterium]|nr:U32 family peptidase [Erysipelotrichales bacterium]
MTDNVELLAPAGNLEKMKFAFLYGADAVYFGGKNYSLRANAKNFSESEMKEAVEYAHSLGKKVYVTVNIVFHNEDLIGLEDYLRYLSSIKVDAIITSDLAVMSLINEKDIDLEIHVSTQASILNHDAALFYKSIGATRVVLAREASKEDIKRIKSETGLELECFVHGAMCTSISGRCVLSNYCTNRDSNRGGCAQICRWTFGYSNGEELVTDKPFSMTPKDLNMITHVEDMINIGVNSFKIEGRMRSIYYISTVILIYRRIIDKIKNNTLTEEYKRYALNILNRVANRESAPQFYEGLPGVDEQYYLGREELSNQDFLGLVIDYQDGVITVEQRNNFKVGDEIQAFGPNHDTYSFKIEYIINENGENIDVARHPQMIIKINSPYKLEKNDMLRIKMFDI